MSPVRLRIWMPRLMTLTALALVVGATLAWAAKSAPTKDAAAKAAPAASAATPAAKPDAAAAAKQQKEMEDMMKLAMPGAQHEKLKACVGTWNATVKSFMGGPEPQVSRGVAEMQMVLGGRYLEQKYKGTFMNQPFEGQGLTGFDNQRNVYQSVWVDNISTWMMVSEGNMDDASKAIEMKANAMGMDGKPTQMRTEMKFVDPSTIVFSMFGDMGGKEAMMMEITYKKAS